MSGISGNLVGTYSQIGKTFILTGENGVELTGVVVDQETIFDATDNDVREGKIYASDSGMSTGSKVIPPYFVTEAARAIPAGSACTIPLPSMDLYDYTKLQVIICAYNASLEDSVSAEKVSINNKMYAVGSTVVISDVIKDADNKSINLGITNDSSSPVILRYFTYKEIE